MKTPPSRTIRARLTITLPNGRQFRTERLAAINRLLLPVIEAVRTGKAKAAELFDPRWNGQNTLYIEKVGP